MAQRTDPVEALERIAWYLNFRKGETLSLNQISEATGLAWATVQKYTKAIEVIQKLTPRISTTTEGIKVGRRTNPMEAFMSDPAPALAAYLFVQAQQEGSPTGALNISEHEEVLDKSEAELQKLESLGWVEMSEGTIRLTPLGVQIAGPAHSAVKNGKKDEDILKIDRSQNRAVIDSSEPSRSSESPNAPAKSIPLQSNIDNGLRGYTESGYDTPQYS